jgi:hypothetical protein
VKRLNSKEMKWEKKDEGEEKMIYEEDRKEEQKDEVSEEQNKWKHVSRSYMYLPCMP